MALVRLLAGKFTLQDAIAINAFETIVVGGVTDLTQGLTVTGNCSWGTTIITPRF
jgi:hypothetical protein